VERISKEYFLKMGQYSQVSRGTCSGNSRKNPLLSDNGDQNRLFRGKSMNTQPETPFLGMEEYFTGEQSCALRAACSLPCLVFEPVGPDNEPGLACPDVSLPWQICMTE
jgi:hypothetical protein